LMGFVGVVDTQAKQNYTPLCFSGISCILEAFQ